MSTQQTQHAQIQGPPWALDCNTIKVCLKTPVRGVISHSLFLQTKRINRYRVRLRFCHIPSEDRKFYTELGWGLRNRLAQTLLEPEQHISNCSYLMISNLSLQEIPHKDTLIMTHIINVVLPIGSFLNTLYPNFLYVSENQSLLYIYSKNVSIFKRWKVHRMKIYHFRLTPRYCGVFSLSSPLAWQFLLMDGRWCTSEHRDSFYQNTLTIILLSTT